MYATTVLAGALCAYVLNETEDSQDLQMMMVEIQAQAYYPHDYYNHQYKHQGYYTPHYDTNSGYHTAGNGRPKLRYDPYPTTAQKNYQASDLNYYGHIGHGYDEYSDSSNTSDGLNDSASDIFNSYIKQQYNYGGGYGGHGGYGGYNHGYNHGGYGYKPNHYGYNNHGYGYNKYGHHGSLYSGNTFDYGSTYYTNYLDLDGEVVLQDHTGLHGHALSDEDYDWVFDAGAGYDAYGNRTKTRGYGNVSQPLFLYIK